MISEDLRLKVKNAFNKDFIGDVIFSTDEIDELLIYVKQEYRNGQHISPSLYLFYMCLVIIIIDKSRNYGSDNETEEKHYWEDIFREILNDEKIIPYNSGNIRLDEFFDRQHKILLRDSSYKTRRFKQTLLYNSFSPKYSLEAFIKIVFDAYVSVDNINTGFFEESYEIDKKPYEKFVEDFSNKLQGVKDLETSVFLYNQWYKLSAAMRHGFTQDKEKIAKLVSRTIVYIKKYFLKEPIYDGTYFSKIVSDYLTKEKIKNIDNNLIAKVERVRSINDWYAYYTRNKDDDESRLYIRMPLLKLNSINQYENIKYYLYLDNKIIETKSLDIVGYDYNPHINPIAVDITKYLRNTTDQLNFKIEIFAKGYNKPIFSTDDKSSLIRPFLIFTDSSQRENKDEIINPKAYILAIIPNGFVQKFLNSESFKDARRIIDNVYEIQANSNEYVSYANKTVYFVDVGKEIMPLVDGIKLERISFESTSGVKYDAYQKVSLVKIIPNKDYYSQSNKFEIYITNISDNQKIITKTYPLLMNNDLKSNGIVMKAEEYPELNNFGINTIEIIRCDNSKTVTRLSYFCGNFFVSLSEKGISKKDIVSVVLKRDNQIVLNEVYKISEKNAYYPFSLGHIIICLPYLEFKLDGLIESEKKYLTGSIIARKIYTPGDLLSEECCSLRIKNMTDSHYKIFLDEEEIKETNGYYDIGKSLKNHIEKIIELYILYTNAKNEGNHKICIFKLYKDEYFDPNGLSITYDDGKFYYQITGFVGDKRPIFKIDLFDCENTCAENPLITNPFVLEGLSGSFTIDNFEEGYYKLIVKRMIFVKNDYKVQKILLRKVSEDDEYLFGDLDKSRFDGISLYLEKITNLCKTKDMKKYSIVDIKYIKHDVYPVYSGRLILDNKKNGLDVYFVYKERTIILYSDYENNKLMYFNENTKEITNCSNDNEKIIRSVYIKEID